MGIFSRLFDNKKSQDTEPILVDMHSHLLPGIDDGVQNLDDSLSLIKEFSTEGYKKLILTPHIMGDFYKNTPEIIRASLENLKKHVIANDIRMELDAAAEYYLDENFMRLLRNKEQLLTFGDNYLLIETSYMSEPMNFAATLSEIKAAGYWPILAHPERYNYLYQDFKKFKEVHDLGISFQINLNSISGYYSKQAQHYAMMLVKNNMVHFVGSDCHNFKHMESLKFTRKSKDYQKVLSLHLFNNSLL
jgi:protein-tyrosine phosphatase